MRLKKYTRKPSFIEVVWEQRNSQGDYEEHAQKFKEAPMPVLNTAVQDLKAPLQTILEVTDAWMETVTNISSFTVHYTAAGVRSFEIKFTKAFKIDTTRDYTSPQFRIDPPEEDEDNVPRAINIDEAILCVTAMEAVEAYVGGDRQQMTLQGVEKKTEGADSNEGNELGLDDEADANK